MNLNVTLIWLLHELKISHQLYQEVKSGIFRELADLEGKGRLEFHTTAQFRHSLNTVVRAGQHVMTELGINLKSLMALDFSQRGNITVHLIVATLMK